MWHPPRTIKAALLAGFMLNFALWLASAYYFTRRVVESEARIGVIHARFLRGHELLFSVQNQVLLGSIYLRDALNEPNEHSATVARERLRALQARVVQDLAQYESIDSAVDATVWRRLEGELRDYWETVAQLTARESARPNGTAPAPLRTHVIPKPDAITQISDEIRGLMAEDYSREDRQLNELHHQLRRRLAETTVVAVGLGLGALLLTTWYVGGLESQIRERQEQVARNRAELQRLSARLVSAQEDERRTVARELHDEVGQALTAVKAELAVAEQSVGADPRAVAALSGARSVTEHALTSVRDLSQLLRPAMLDDFGLPDTLKWYVRKFSDRTSIRTELIEDGLSERLPADIEVGAYRAIQEGLTNVARHARATSCRVFVQRLSASLVVTVEDDGCGFQADSDAPVRSAGLGLVGIRERAVNLGGTFRIESGRGKGTRLTVEFPLAIGAQT